MPDAQRRAGSGPSAPTRPLGTARWLWIAAALVGVVGNGANYLMLTTGNNSADILSVAIAEAAAWSVLLGLLVAVVLGVVLLGLAVPLGRGWLPARWPLLVFGLIGIALDALYLAGSWVTVGTSVLQIIVILLAIAVMFGRGTRTPHTSVQSPGEGE
jgi:hypothetical protein